MTSIVLGQGSFGQVKVGIYRKQQKVAVKIIKAMEGNKFHPAQISGIENELLIMEYLRAPLRIECLWVHPR